MDKCPKCGAVEIEADTPRTVYSCGSSDYDNRPGTFKRGDNCNMDIEFIKWMCGKAEEYEFYEGDFIDDNYIETPCLQEIHQNEFDSDDWIKSLYPLLLQRAIEGVNRYNLYEGFFIAYDNLYIKVCDCKTNKVLKMFEIDDQDQAKKESLQYIYEQEKK